MDRPQNDLPTCKIPTDINILALIYHISMQITPPEKEQDYTFFIRIISGVCDHESAGCAIQSDSQT